jgi:hypothetical protein
MDTIEILMKKLPIEIINIILSFRPRHPTAEVMKPFMNAYITYVNDYDYLYVDLNHDFRYFSEIVRQYDFMARVECKKFQSHFITKLEKGYKKYPFSTINSLHIFEQLDKKKLYS